MTDSPLFKTNSDDQPLNAHRSNVPEFSVGDLALSLKRTLEDNYGRIRVRGELSRVSIASSGHMYSVLKDDNAVIDAVCWKGVLNSLSVRPEEGLEVICTGRISSYPKSSKYQLIIESMELAGEGALLKMLEERRKKLSAEGLFEPGRKKNLPFLPDVIGVVTSPTGAVIRDILHRLHDRFPRHVIVWPVLVQGEGAAQQVAHAIEGFDTLSAEGAIPKPDLIIVARGGGSLEDLMAFNEEMVVRAIANCKTPIISAIGHETDTTLADYAADYRAPTPTGAAEMAVPRRADLMARIMEDEKRLYNGLRRSLDENAHKLDAMRARLGDPSRLLESRAQNLDFQGEKLHRVFKGFIQSKESKLDKLQITHPRHRLDRAKQALEFQSEKLKSAYNGFLRQKEHSVSQMGSKIQAPHHKIQNVSQMLEKWVDRLTRTMPLTLEKKRTHLDSVSRVLHSLSYEQILNRGFVVVRDENNLPVTQPDQIERGVKLQLEFANNRRIGVVSEEIKDKQDKLF